MSADVLTEEEHELVNRYAKDFSRRERPSASFFVLLRSVSWVLLLLCVLFRDWFYLVFERIPALDEIGCGRAGCGARVASFAGAVVIFAIVLLCYLWKHWKWYKALAVSKQSMIV